MIYVIMLSVSGLSSHRENVMWGPGVPPSRRIANEAPLITRVIIMTTSSSGNIFRVTGHLCGEFTSEFPHKRQWRGALMFSLICVWVNNHEAGDLRSYRAHYDVIVMAAGVVIMTIYNAISDDKVRIVETLRPDTQLPRYNQAESSERFANYWLIDPWKIWMKRLISH